MTINKPHWLLNYIKNALVIVSGLVPVVGPILSMGAALGMEAIINPDEFMDELREQIPAVELTQGIPIPPLMLSQIMTAGPPHGDVTLKSLNLMFSQTALGLELQVNDATARPYLPDV